jgi:hypothetical protein
MVHHVMLELWQARYRWRGSRVLPNVHKGLGSTQQSVIQSSEQITLKNNKNQFKLMVFNSSNYFHSLSPQYLLSLTLYRFLSFFKFSV